MAELSFEKALAELESIVGKLEEGRLSLNDSLTLFEKGVKLARFLRQELDKAEKKTEILLKNEKGEVRAAPLDLEKEELSLEGEKEPDEGEDNGVPF